MPGTPDHVQLPLQPPLYFLGYLLSAFVLQWIVPLAYAPWILPLRVVGGVLVIAGLVLGGSAISAMRRAQTTPDPHQPTTALVTDGPYRLTRNPIYLGFLLDYVGFTLLDATLWGLLLSPFLIGTVGRQVIRLEETYLRGKFTAQYEDYFARVRRWV